MLTKAILEKKLLNITRSKEISETERFVKLKGLIFEIRRYNSHANNKDKVDFNFTTHLGDTPLINLVIRGDSDSVDFFVNLPEVDPNYKNVHSKTALMFAVITRNLDCLLALIKAKANFDTTYKGETALDQAVHLRIKGGDQVVVLKMICHLCIAQGLQFLNANGYEKGERAFDKAKTHSADTTQQIIKSLIDTNLSPQQQAFLSIYCQKNFSKLYEVIKQKHIAYAGVQHQTAPKPKPKKPASKFFNDKTSDFKQAVVNTRNLSYRTF